MDVLNFALERDDLCERFGGGLPSGCLVVIEGEHGAGKSILTQRVTYGLVHNGHTVTLVSSELTTSGFLAQMKSLHYAIEQPMLDEKLVFIPVYPLMGQRAARNEYLGRILEAKRMYTKEVVIFDNFSKFLQDHMRHAQDPEAGLEQVESALYLFKRLSSMGKTIVLTFEHGQTSEEIVNLYKEAADLSLTLKFELNGNTPVRRIVVNRLSRASGRFGEVIGFRVEPGVGIVVEIRSVV